MREANAACYTVVTWNSARIRTWSTVATDQFYPMLFDLERLHIT